MRFETLRETLLVGGISPRRVKRYLAELEDHLADLTAQERAAGYEPEDAAIRAQAMLGSEAELAEGWLNHSRLKSFTARAPWAVFAILPPVVALLAFILLTLGLVAIARTHGMTMGHAVPAPGWFRLTADIVTLTSNLLLGPLLACLLIVMAQRQRLNVKWPLIGMAIIALQGLQLHARFPAPGEGKGSIFLGMLPVAGHLPEVYWQTLPAQWLILLGLGTGFLILRRRTAKPA